MFKIEKDIPVPPQAYRYPFREMEVGDSFSIPADADGFYANNRGKRAHRVQQAASYHSTNGKRFTAWIQPDGSCRVWRVE